MEAFQGRYLYKNSSGWGGIAGARAAVGMYDAGSPAVRRAGFQHDVGRPAFQRGGFRPGVVRWPGVVVCCAAKTVTGGPNRN